MRKSLLISIFFIAYILLGTKGVFAVEITCPPGEKVDASSDAISNSITECLDARKNHNEASLNTAGKNFYCPSGNFTTDDGQPLTDERIAMQVAMSILFAEIDQDALTKICAMRESRNTDAVPWMKQINESFTSSPADESTSGADTEKSSLARYRDVCKNGVVSLMNKINQNSEKKQWVTTSNAFPQSLCEAKAEQKADAWTKLGHVLMSDGMAKGYQNSKDVYIDKIKTKYDKLRNKIHGLQEYIAQGTAKLTNLIKKAVK